MAVHVVHNIAGFCQTFMGGGDGVKQTPEGDDGNTWAMVVATGALSRGAWVYRHSLWANHLFYVVRRTII